MSGIKFYLGLNIVSKCVQKNIFCSSKHWSLFFYQSVWRYMPDRKFGITTFCTKGVRGVEKEFARWVFENNPAYMKTIYVPESKDSVCNDSSGVVKNPIYNDSLEVVDWKNCTAEDIVRTLKFLSSKDFNSLDTEVVDNLSSSLRNVCPQFDDSEIIESLKCFINWGENSIKFVNCEKLWKPLDLECGKRVKKWNTETIFLVTDLLYLCYLEKHSKAFILCMMALGRRKEYLSCAELIRCMFCLSLNFDFRKFKGIFEYEHCLSKFIDKLTIEEISIICMGFRMAQKPFYMQTTYDHILKKTIDNIDTVKSVALNAILRMLQVSLPLSHLDQLNILIEKALPNIERLSLCCCVTLAGIGCSKPVFHKELMDIVANRFVNEIETASMKDIERMTTSLYVYNYQPDIGQNIYEAIIEQFHNPSRVNELFTNCLVISLANMAMKNIYCDQMTNFVLNSIAYTKIYGKKFQFLGHELLILDTCVEIDRPLYEGHRLNKKVRAIITKEIQRDIPSRHKEKHPFSDQLLVEVFLACEKVFGEENVCTKHLLPHFERADILVGVRGNKHVIPVPDFFWGHKTGDVKYAPDFKDDDKWYVLVIGYQNNFFQRTETYTGYIEAKLRQLRTIGYHPVLIPWFDWMCLTSAEKKDYVRKIIFKEETEEDSIITANNIQ